MELWKDVKAEESSDSSDNEKQLTLGFAEKNTSLPDSDKEAHTSNKDKDVVEETGKTETDKPAANAGPNLFKPSQSQIDAALKKQQSHASARENKQVKTEIKTMQELTNKEPKAPGKKAKNNAGSLEEETFKTGVISFGKYLQETRIEQGYSLSQVEDGTKIRSYYIEALENELVNKLPPGVFIFAYVRSICAFYKIPQGKVDFILEELKSKIDSNVPQELYENINLDYEVDQESEQRLRNLTWLISGAAVLFIAIVTVAVILLLPGKPSKKVNTIVQGSKVDQAKVETIITGKPQTLDISALPVNDR
ncbi:MAG: hypothetical protein GY750_01690 [Lentisphaerae bacterium]|nr:hypothetical protein [Lentisphaerota bacterium]MCP4100133.1 hypothetical protein [Lentisphaerota bacterium]